MRKIRLLLLMVAGACLAAVTMAVPSAIAEPGDGAYTVAGLADWDRDGHVDIVARENATGNLWLYRGASVRGYSPYPRVEIGNGWQMLEQATIVVLDHGGGIVTTADTTSARSC